MDEVEGYIRDLGKTVPSLEGKWVKDREYERLCIVYTTDGSDDDGGDTGGEKVLVQVINNQGAKITINGDITSSKKVTKGTNVLITLEKEGYRTKTVTINNIQQDYVDTIEFSEDDRLKYTVNVTSNVPNTKIYINNREQSTIEVYWGENVSIKAEPVGYYPKEQTVTNIRENKNILVEFTDADKISTKYMISVSCNLDYDTCTINGVNTSMMEIYEGQDAAIVVKKEGYYDKAEFLTNVRANQTVQIDFTDDDRIRSTITFSSNQQNTLFKAYDENENEVPITNNSVIVEYDGYVKIVAKVDGYRDKEKVFTNVREDDSHYFEFTDEDLLPAFRISSDKVYWDRTIGMVARLGVWVTLYFKTISGTGVKMGTGGGISIQGNVTYDAGFDVINGEQVYKFRINSMSSDGVTSNPEIGFEFHEQADDSRGSQYGWVGCYVRQR